MFPYFPKWSLIESMVISPTERSLLLFNCEEVSPFSCDPFVKPTIRK